MALLGSCAVTCEITARPVNLLERMKQARSLSHKTIMHRKQHCVCLLLLIKVFISLENMYSSEGPCSWLLRSGQYMCCIIHSSTPLNITTTICVGYHVVVLFRHSAYDGSWFVTADVTFPKWAINKYSAAMACCGVHSCSNKLLKQFV